MEMFSCAYFETLKKSLKKHLRVSTSDYSFALLIYLLSAVPLQSKRKTMIFHGKENVH